MSPKLPSVWPRPPHTKAKHDILVKYLQAWYGILGGSSFVNKVGVLDGFAGPGVYAGGEPGSPVLLLEALLDHSHFARWSNTDFVLVFNEKDKHRFASLEEVVGDLRRARSPWPKNVHVDLKNSGFAEYAEDLLGGLRPGEGLIPLFAFIDPFGYTDISMDLIGRLLSYDKAELFIYFDFNSVNRFAGKGAGVDHRFEELFGCSDFVDAPASGPDRRQFLHDLYEKQLRSVCRMAHVRSFAMVNERGHIGNYLFFATRNLQAFDRMKYAMWSLDPTGEYRFEDQLAGQLVLPGSTTTDTSPLQTELASHFSGKLVRIEDVTNYVIAETPYHQGHVKVKTLRPMQSAGIISSPNQRRAGYFPDGTLIQF